MKKSRILILLLAIIMIVSISAVSAVEMDDSSDSDILSVENDAIDEDVQSVVDSEIMSADGGNSGDNIAVGNFSSLSKIINDDETGTVELNQNYAFDSENDTSFVNGIPITKSITIDGKGHTIDGKNSAKIFQLNAANILIKNITFINGKSEGTNPQGSDYGGAIFSNGAYANHTISECKFYNNTAYNGGAIALYGDDSKIIGCEFEDNNATASGGAVFVIGYNNAIVDSTFKNNEAKEHAGAVAWFSAKTGVVQGSTFISNVAGQAGGAISWQKAGGQIIDSTFTGNEAPNAGAVYWTGNEGTISGGKFSKNKATGNLGGAIFVDANANAKKLTISSTFEENSALNGGAVALYNDAEILKSEFTNNSASSQGAALFAQATTNLTESVFKENKHVEGSSDIYNAATGKLNLKNNTFDSENPIVSDGEIEKPGSNVTISPIDNVTYGNPVVVYYTIGNRSSNVTVSICYYKEEGQPNVEDVNYTIDDEKVTIYDLFVNEYLIIIFNNEDNNYAGNSSYAVFNVTKATPVIEIRSIEVDEYGNIAVTANITKGTSPQVTYLFSNLDTNVNTTKDVPITGEGYINYGVHEPFAQGRYNVQISYDGGENFEKAETVNATVEVTKQVPVIEIQSIKVNEYGAIVVNANITKGVSGNVTFTFKNTDTDKNITVPGIAIGENGTIEYDELTPFEKGSYTVVIEYAGDDKYYAAEDSTYVDVNKNCISPSTTYLNVTGGEVNVTVDLGVPATGNVSVVYPSGYVDNVTIVGGKVNIYNTFMTEQGNLRFVLDYAGDDNYYGFYEYWVDFFIKYDSDLKVDAKVNEYGIIDVVANVNKTATGTVSFIIKNSTEDIVAEGTETIVNGSANYYELAQYAKGKYTIEVKYSGDSQFESQENALNEVEVDKTYTSMEYTVNVVGGEVSITVTLNSDINGNLTVIYPSGYEENVTITNGSASINAVFMTETGDLAITASFAGNDQYYAKEAIIGFVIKEATLIKTSTSVSVVYKNNAKVTVKLTNLVTNKAIAGAPIEITVNGKTYKGTTDKDGNAVITIPANMIPKKYTANVVYKGTDRLESALDEFTLTVKKATPKVTAKKKTFKKSKKVKKYTITLKDNKGKAIKKAKVTIKVGKKTFTAKTNAKGKAVFKLKKLTKKAKYNAKITYKGNKYFNKVTKKVKITIK